MSSLTGNKTVFLLAMLTVGFAVASSAIAMPTAAFASGYNHDDDKYNGDHDYKYYKYYNHDDDDDNNCDDNNDDDDDDDDNDHYWSSYDSKWSDYKNSSYNNDDDDDEDDDDECDDDNGHDDNGHNHYYWHKD